MKSLLKISLILLIISTLISFFILKGNEQASLEALKLQKDMLIDVYAMHQTIFAVIFFVSYVLVTALSIPVATAFTLLGGAIFGFIPGLIMASFASTIGATLAFLIARFLLKTSIQKKYAKSLEHINNGFKKDGAFFLFALRLTPLFPFFLVNLVMGILPIRLSTFYLISQIGMLPGTAVYVFAGTELGKLESLSDIASPSLLIAFTLLGIFPLLAKKLITLLTKQRNHGKI